MSAVELISQRLDPTEAEIRATGDDLVAGRLMGPRCPYASTVEVAYYFKSLPGGGLRTLVPEPSFWDPQSPFLYEAHLTTAGGAKVQKRHGLRLVQLARAGLRVNRRPFRAVGAVRNELTDAASLRASGVDTLVCPVTPATAPLWAEADVLGFFMVGLVSRSAESFALARDLKRHASCLGWIVEAADALAPEELQTRPGVEPLLGILADKADIDTPSWVQFLAGPTALANGRLPWLCIDETGETAAEAAFGVVRGSVAFDLAR
jgi:hypothetical protein